MFIPSRSIAAESLIIEVRGGRLLVCLICRGGIGRWCCIVALVFIACLSVQGCVALHLSFMCISFGQFAACFGLQILSLGLDMGSPIGLESQGVPPVAIGIAG